MDAMILVATRYLNGEISWPEARESMSWALAAVSSQQAFKRLCEKITKGDEP